MLIECAAFTHPGRVRKNNEDSFLLSSLDGEAPAINMTVPQSLKVGSQGLLAAVADGMGGAAAGEVASREGLAASFLYLFGHWGRLSPEESTEDLLLDNLRRAVQGASDAVLRYSDDDRTARGMGSTLTAAILWRDYVYIAQIGDSRAYLKRGDRLLQLTEDQTLVRDLLAHGTITPEQARNHPHRNMITQALGVPQPLTVAITRILVRRNDRLLLCSDGLHGEVEDIQIMAALNDHQSPKKALEVLIQKALDHGGRDNVTAIILDFSDPEIPPPETGEEPIAEVPPFDKGAVGFWTRFKRRLGGKHP